MKKKKQSLEKLLEKMTSRQRVVCNRIREDFALSFNVIPGSSYNHQAWKGGYRDHIEEVMNTACVLYENLNSKRKLNFSLGDALFLLFLHDMDKIFRYKVVSGRVVRKNDYAKSFIQKTKTFLRNKYRHYLSSSEMNVLLYVHGEGEDYSSQKRVMNPLAAFIHCCDIISARIWFDKGRDTRYW